MAKTAKPGLPVAHERQQGRVARRRERGRRFLARGLALVEERLELLGERRARELIGEHRREADRHGRRDVLLRQLLQLLDQREIGVERGLAQPVADVGRSEENTTDLETPSNVVYRLLIGHQPPRLLWI